MNLVIHSTERRRHGEAICLFEPFFLGTNPTYGSTQLEACQNFKIMTGGLPSKEYFQFFDPTAIPYVTISCRSQVPE